MGDSAQEIKPVNIEDELKQSYLDYAMSVIVGRALPDVRDGLKPVHRRVLYAMHELGNEWNKPYKKSARVVGDVIGKYHPHGDSSVYDALVRMAQPFSLRYLLIDGQGNFGSVDGDPPAAMRYTEVRMTKMAHNLLADLDKDTVDFVPNYDDSELQPTVLPAQIPNLLINGGTGIAVGMATNIPPHNLGEVINACLHLLDNPNASVVDLLCYLPGPDFPTAGIINGRAGIATAYKTGRGRIYVRGRTNIEQQERQGKQSIIITELPYQVNKARLIEKIAELVKDKKIDGISGLRDESDKDGMRVVIELKKGEIADVVLNKLYSYTQLQVAFGFNMVALVDGRPRCLTLVEMLQCFLEHRRQVVSRRTQYELNKSRERAHILEGLGVALANIDAVIALIKAAPSPQEAKSTLLATIWQAGQVSALLERVGGEITRPLGIDMSLGLQIDDAGNATYRLSAEQAQAILDLRLHRLTGLEQDKIAAEYSELLVKIAGFLDILANVSSLLAVIRQELIAIKDNFADSRRTEIQDAQHDLCEEDLIQEEEMVVTLSEEGYIKAQPLSGYQAQHRGGRGKIATSVKAEDYVKRLVIANTHDTLLCFSSTGKLYWLKCYQIPVSQRTSKGRAIVNLLALTEQEKISAILAVRSYEGNKTIFMATAFGVVKRVALQEFQRPRSKGMIAIDLTEGDSLIGVELADTEETVMLATTAGKAIRFPINDVRCVGRSAKGVRGVKLLKGQAVISLMVLKPGGMILTATEHGYGKCTDVEAYTLIGRGGQGTITIQTSERNGKVIGALQVFSGDELILISDQGTLVRTRVDEISVVGRTAQGVKLINLAEQEYLVAIQRVSKDIIAIELESEE